ncbi:uncharacterized protein B0H64DRAFT_51130 [Chaetomium fimeti]|uniref:Rhodopsin domain-containing protein n=1 Tax=Chaetomium fimeti TaxID=1854472 RepID=A0AAE0H8S6_9PEZI|nr:hypothetical protein B0H64DRAFT_51130 [Chaetomium fimeti]
MAWTDGGPPLFAFSLVMLLLSTVAVTLRFVCRGYILRVLGLSDLFILLTLICSLAHVCILGIIVSRGLGLPKTIFEFTPDEREFFFKMRCMSKLVVNLSIVMTKLSVLLLFLDIFLTAWPRRATYVIIVLTALFGVWIAVTNIFPCIPIDSSWKSEEPERRCMDIGQGKSLTDAVVSFVLDMAIFCLPLPVVWPMTLPWRQKAWLYFAFALGFFVCVASAIRIVFVMTSAGDPNSGPGIPYWVATEINVAIVVACIPTLRLLVVKICPRMLETTEPASKTSNRRRSPQPE